MTELPVPLRPTGDEVADAVRQELAVLLEQRGAAETRAMNWRLACDRAVSEQERDPGPERERLREALAVLAALDQQIDAAGLALRRLDAGG